MDKVNNAGFACLGKGCPNHCCGAFNGVSDKLRELDVFAFSEIVLLPDDIRRIRQAGKEDYIARKEDGIWTMKTADDGTCAALRGGRCDIYEVRPSLCKAYPLYLDLFAGLCCVTECPAFDPAAPHQAYQEALRSLLDVMQYWINRYRERL